MYLRKRVILVVLVNILLKAVEGEVSLLTVLGTLGANNNSSFFGRFDGHHKFTFKELWENLHHRFFSFPQNQIFRYMNLSVANCRLIENILDTFFIAANLV